MQSPILTAFSNLILHFSISFILILLLKFLSIPTLLLQGLQTYIHPDDVNPSTTNPSQQGIRARIHRPGAVESEPKPRKKSKEKFDFDENKAQIFRLKLNDSQLQTRLYFAEFSRVFSFTIVAILSLLFHQFLNVSEGSGVLGTGSVVPILLGFVGVCRIVVLIARVSFERSASKRSEKQLSFVLGVLGFVLGLSIVFEMVPKWALDFEFGSMDGFGKFTIAVFMGCIVGFLYMPATRNARAFWLGTDQIRCNLSIISCGLVEKMLLYANYVLTVFSSLLWINPFAELLVNLNGNTRTGSKFIGVDANAGVLVGNVGVSRSDFDNCRIICLLALGMLQIVTLRSNVQIFLNEAVLCWYQRLHVSKVPDLDYSRAKVFLHNHYLCLVVLQFFAVPALVLLFLGLSQIDGTLFKDSQWLCSLLPCSALVNRVALFVAWWVVFVWALFTSVILALYRRGVLYVS